MKYEFAPDLQVKAEEMIRFMFPHILADRVKCLRSYGSSSKYIIARCHSLGKLMQNAMNTKSFYAIEFLSENFDKLDEEDKLKTIMHELMHIPKTFGGGFKHHDFVKEKNVNKYFTEYKKRAEDIDKKEKLKFVNGKIDYDVDQKVIELVEDKEIFDSAHEGNNDEKKKRKGLLEFWK